VISFKRARRWCAPFERRSCGRNGRQIGRLLCSATSKGSPKRPRSCSPRMMRRRRFVADTLDAVQHRGGSRAGAARHDPLIGKAKKALDGVTNITSVGAGEKEKWFKALGRDGQSQQQGGIEDRHRCAGVMATSARARAPPRCLLVRQADLWTTSGLGATSTQSVEVSSGRNRGAGSSIDASGIRRPERVVGAGVVML